MPKMVGSCVDDLDALLTADIAVYINNHTEVWGSWYDPTSGQWGFACCHSNIHLSYCTGEAGIVAAEASSAQHLLASSSSAPPQESDDTPSSKPSGSTVEDRRKKAEELFSKKRLGEGELKLDDRKLADALQAERDRKRKGRGEEEEWGSKKKKAATSYEVTEEELGESRILSSSSTHSTHCDVTEAYRMNRRMTEDPMANYVDDSL